VGNTSPRLVIEIRFLLQTHQLHRATQALLYTDLEGEVYQQSDMTI